MSQTVGHAASSQMSLDKVRVLISSDDLQSIRPSPQASGRQLGGKGLNCWKSRFARCCLGKEIKCLHSSWRLPDRPLPSDDHGVLAPIAAASQHFYIPLKCSETDARLKGDLILEEWQQSGFREPCVCSRPTTSRKRLVRRCRLL